MARGGYYFRERRYPLSLKDRYRDFTGGLRLNHYIDNQADNHTARHRYLEASYNFDQFDKSGYDTDSRRDVRNYTNQQHTARLLYNHTFGGRHILTLGGDGMTDYLMTYQFDGGGNGNGNGNGNIGNSNGSVSNRHGAKEQYTADAFAQFDWQLRSDLTLLAGVRYDYFSHGNKAQFSPKIAMKYDIGRDRSKIRNRAGDKNSGSDTGGNSSNNSGWLTLRASYGKGFRAPTLKEMYMEFDMAEIFTIFGNPHLKSEVSHNFMLSGEYTRQLWNITLSGSYNSVRNRIGTAWDTGLGGMKYVNSRSVNIAGAEVAFTLKLPGGFGGKLSYAYTREMAARGDTITSDTRPHSAVLRLEYGRKFRDYGFNATLTGRYMSPVDTYELAGDYRSYEKQKTHYGGYTMWRLVVSQQIWNPFTLTLTINNLLNYKPKPFRYNSPLPYGTTFEVGLSVDFERLFGRDF